MHDFYRGLRFYLENLSQLLFRFSRNLLFGVLSKEE